MLPSFSLREGHSLINYSFLGFVIVHLSEQGFGVVKVLVRHSTFWRVVVRIHLMLLVVNSEASSSCGMKDAVCDVVMIVAKKFGV